MKPRNVKQAFEQDFKVKSIYAKGSKQIRVSFERRFPKPDKCKRLEVTKVELYKINEELPKRIFLTL